MIEGACDPATKEGRWITEYDIVEVRKEYHHHYPYPARAVDLVPLCRLAIRTLTCTPRCSHWSDWTNLSKYSRSHRSSRRYRGLMCWLDRRPFRCRVFSTRTDVCHDDLDVSIYRCFHVSCCFHFIWHAMGSGNDGCCMHVLCVHISLSLGFAGGGVSRVEEAGHLFPLQRRVRDHCQGTNYLG